MQIKKHLLIIALLCAAAQWVTNIEKAKRIYIGKKMELVETSENLPKGLLFDFHDLPKSERVELVCTTQNTVRSFPYSLVVKVDGPHLWVEWQGESYYFVRRD